MKCYDCRKEITKNRVTKNIYSEDGNLMALDFHEACYERATNGGQPVEESDEQTT